MNSKFLLLKGHRKTYCFDTILVSNESLSADCFLSLRGEGREYRQTDRQNFGEHCFEGPKIAIQMTIKHLKTDFEFVE